MGHPPEPALTGPALTGPALWRRAAAIATDAVTVFFLLWALVVVRLLWFMDDLSQAVDPAPWNDRFVATLLFTLLFAVYEIVFLAWNDGRTPGKALFEVRVVGADGGPPTRSACVVRTLAVAPLFMVPPLGLGLALVAATGLPAVVGRRRSWPDLVAGTATTRFADTRTDPVDDRRREVREEAAPPTVFTLLIGRRNARRFARTEPGARRRDTGHGER